MDLLVKSTQDGFNSILNLGIESDGILGAETNLAKDVFIKWLHGKMLSQKYIWNSTGNLIGIRMNDTYTNGFTDWGVITLKNDCICFRMSTKPGIGKVLNPPTVAGVKGVAVMKEGQYLDLYKLNGPWWSGMDFLLQEGAVIAYRDFDLNDTISRAVEQTDQTLGYRFSLNFHSYKNSKWSWNLPVLSYLRPDKTYSNLSEGCQVVTAETMGLIMPYLKELGKQGRIAYTLLNFTTISMV